MKLKYISWFPAVLIMGMIFLFSSKPAAASDESSLVIANTILNVYENVSDTQYEIELRTEKLNVIDHVVRKSAHFTEYALLACAIAFHFFVWKRKRIWWLLAPIIFAGLYAATDEFHQTMVQGRSGQIRDVLLDTAGAVTGIFLLWLIRAIIAKRKMKREKVATSPQ
ncbi:MAG: hypothetical protein K0S01_2926 [Herbinix sp.]|nr:hypothetical protein [Herbinix sp.]